VAWLLLTVHVHASVRLLIVPLFYSICSIAVQHTMYNVAVLPILGMLMSCGVLAHNIVDSLHLHSLSVPNIFVT
jgi:hypothetical protein